MLSNKEKGTIDTNNLDGSQGHYAKGGGTLKRVCTLWVHLSNIFEMIKF